ncbi:MAG: ABC transporter ATP-binding protein [Bacteroidetes bacterium]|nr:ABC transporter ATP-binding protein [Bacteroidota bacterium]
MIKLENLKKSFGLLEVLKSVSFDIGSGTVAAIIGPNGSGKSTIIKSILGLVKPDDGNIWVRSELLRGGADYKKQVGYMPQQAKFPENLTVAELLRMITDLRGGPADTDLHLYEAFRLEAESDKALRTLSGGTRQKVNAHLAFMFKPEILILDEPTAGLDPISSSILKDKIHLEKEKGRTIIITSHILSELEELSSKIIFLLDGRICFDGSLSTLRESTGEFTLERSIASLMKGHPLWMAS